MYINKWMLGGLTLLAVLGSVSTAVMGLTVLSPQPQVQYGETQQPCVVITALPYTIQEHGVYCLNADLHTGRGGIVVEADNVTVDLQGHTIFGPTAPDNRFYGIYSLDHEHIIIKNGFIEGFFYGIYLNDSFNYALRDEAFDGGWHTIENLHIANATFRGICVLGNNNVIRSNVIRFIGGSTLYDNAYAFGIENIGPGAMIYDNNIFEIRGYGTGDIGEGVGISISEASRGNIVTRNLIANSAVDPTEEYLLWPAESRSTYDIWLGGNSTNALVTDNQIINFAFGIAYDSSTDGLFRDNTVFGAVVPFANFANVRDEGNICDLADCYEYHPLPPRDEEALEDMER